MQFSGPALCFESEEDMIDAVGKDTNQFKGKVIVIRYEGPKGGPGMPEMLTPTSAIMGAGLGELASGFCMRKSIFSSCISQSLL